MSCAASAGSSALPLWRQRLAAVPVEERCGSQKDLIRAVDILESLTRAFDGSQRLPSPGSLELFRLLVLFLELHHRPIKDRSLSALLPEVVIEKFAACLRNNPLESEIAFSKAFEQQEGEDSSSQQLYKDLCEAVLRLALVQFSELSLISSPPGSVPSLQYLLPADWARDASKLLSSADSTFVDSFLSKFDCLLTLADLMEMSLVLQAEFLLKAAEQGSLDSAAHARAHATALHFINDLESGPISWYASSKLYTVLPGLQHVLSLEEGAECDAKVKAIMRRNVEDAATDYTPDPLRNAWANFDLALMTASPSGWRYDAVARLVEKGNESMKKCDWLPPFFVQVMAEGMEVITMMLKAAKKKYPDDYKERVLDMEVLTALEPSEIDYIMGEQPAPWNVHTCGACGREGRDMSSCSSCKKVFYCNRACQKRGWKEHKADCKP